MMKSAMDIQLNSLSLSEVMLDTGFGSTGSGAAIGSGNVQTQSSGIRGFGWYVAVKKLE